MPDQKMHLTIRTGVFRNESSREQVMSEPEKRWRFENIILGVTQLLPSLGGLNVTEEEGGEFDWPETDDAGRIPYFNRHLAEVSRLGANARVFRAPEFAHQLTKVGDRYVTLTLRMSRYFPDRNINLTAWHGFFKYLAAKKVNVIVIPDQEDVLAFQHYAKFQWPIYLPAALDLRLRLALYEKAIANFGSSNGPVMLAMMSECPMCLFDPMRGGVNKPDYLVDTNGFALGGQLPWRRPDQTIVWQDSSYQTLVEQWERLGLLR